MRFALISLVLAALTVGCATEREEADRTDWTDSQQRALNDPMNYRPQMNRSNVSGGKVHEFDREGFKQDMDTLLLN